MIGEVLLIEQSHFLGFVSHIAHGLSRRKDSHSRTITHKHRIHFKVDDNLNLEDTAAILHQVVKCPTAVLISQAIINGLVPDQGIFVCRHKRYSLITSANIANRYAIYLRSDGNLTFFIITFDENPQNLAIDRCIHEE